MCDKLKHSVDLYGLTEDLDDLHECPAVGDALPQVGYRRTFSGDPQKTVGPTRVLLKPEDCVYRMRTKGESVVVQLADHRVLGSWCHRVSCIYQEACNRMMYHIFAFCRLFQILADDNVITIIRSGTGQNVNHYYRFWLMIASSCLVIRLRKICYTCSNYDTVRLM